jgi:transitional endoplasmic reticulum ATPase
MLEYNLKGVPVAADLTCDEVVTQTDGYSGADIAEVCDRAKRSALKRQLAGEAEAVVGAQDFKHALERVRPVRDRRHDEGLRRMA